MDLISGLQHVFFGQAFPDAWSQATVLDALKTNSSLTIEELWHSSSAFGVFAGYSSEWVNLALLLGGLFLLHKKTLHLARSDWHARRTLCYEPVVLERQWLLTHKSSPLFHLLSGATMLGAFFIVTDPVSSATSVQGRLLFGIGVGVLIYIIRAWGGYPDGVAFAVLLMNLCAPTIDYFTRPRTYGHKTAKRGFKTGDE